MNSPWWFGSLFRQVVVALAVLIVAGCGGRSTLIDGIEAGTFGTADGGPDKTPDGSQTDGGDATDAPWGSRPMLNLLAGALGGSGEEDGTGAAARFCLPSGVASDGAGNLWLADTSNHTIRRVIITTGAVTTLAGSAGNSGSADGTGAAAQFNSPSGVASDGAGNLWVADTWNHTIRRVAIATGVVTTLAGSAGNSGSADGTGAAARFYYPWGVASDGAGNLLVADHGSHTIRRVAIATGVVTTLAGSAGESGGADGIGASARFLHPHGVATDRAGNLFVTDTHTIRWMAIATGAVTTLAGSAGNLGSSDGIGTAARFKYPDGVASDGAGNLFVADRDNYTIRRVAVATGAVTTLAGSAGKLGSTDGVGPAARFHYPSGVTSDDLGNLLVTDAYNDTIRRVVIATGAVTTLAGSAENWGSTDGIGAGARFHYPSGVTSDGAGNLFVADTYNDAIRQVAVATGAVTTLAGTAGYTGSADGTAAAARFKRPSGVTSDGAGNLLVADRENYTIRQIVIATGAVTTLAGLAGVWGSIDGAGSLARFHYPTGVTSDGAGNLFVAEKHTIRQVDIATGAVTTLVGLADTSGSTDGTGPAARFDSPSGLVTDGQGNLLVADSGNHTIRQVVIATGAVTTLAGSPGNAGSTDGTGATARFFGPTRVASDGAGNLFVADSGNHTIRRVVIATGAVTTVVGSPGHQGVVLGPLPAQLSCPSDLAFVTTGKLFIADPCENAILVAQPWPPVAP